MRNRVGAELAHACSWLDPPPLGEPRTNFVGTVAHKTTFHDMRSASDPLSLDRTGFQVASLKTALAYADFAHDERIEGVYYDEVKAMLRHELGAERIVREARSSLR